ncbi:MAG TPA: hypothetical protein VKD28_16135 [Gemmatimonadales bacterium]|nr:hypothetical protein [Gemmatimonadales bacterium]
MNRGIWAAVVGAMILAVRATSAAGQMVHQHGDGTPAVTYAELQRTSAQLAEARTATAKYQDVRVAETDGYVRIGPFVPGLGVHYVRGGTPARFSITEPPILLYEPDATAAGGLRLIGVSYLLVAPTGSDSQPEAPPFPKALASWHKHNNVCVLPDNSATIQLTEQQCRIQSGKFTAETSWMLHAWIWKDNPMGAFSFTNPLVH